MVNEAFTSLGSLCVERLLDDYCSPAVDSGEDIDILGINSERKKERSRCCSN